MASNRLAVVVPALRARFLDQALLSLAAQVVDDFCVYVGDDASQDDLAEVCRAFKNRLNIRHHRFDSNLGSSDLPAHWDRCISLTDGEPVIWLFSDDDVMEPGCVQAVLQAAQAYPQVDLFRCNVSVIDSHGTLLRSEPDYPDSLSSRGFLRGKLGGAFFSHAPEYAFRRRAYEPGRTFPSFPLAWGTDDAAWAQLARRGGLRTVKGPRVLWRESGQNISSARPELRRAKVAATSAFLKWLNTFLQVNPVQAGDPLDAEVVTAARHWFYSHARGVGYRFGWRPDGEIFRNLASLPGHGVLRTWLRMQDSDRYARGTDHHAT